MRVEAAHQGTDAADFEQVGPFAADFADNFPGLIHGFLSAGQIFGGNALQVVDGVEVHILDIGGGGVDVARHGNIHQQGGPALADRHGAADSSGVDDHMRGAGGADDNIGLRQVIIQQFKRNGAPPVAFGQGLAMVEGAVQDEDLAGTFFHQAFQRQFCHFACTDDHDGLGAEILKDFFSKFDGHGTDGHATARNVGFGMYALGAAEGVMEERREVGPQRARIACKGEGLFDLAEDFGFADDHGVQAGGHSQQMFDSG